MKPLVITQREGVGVANVLEVVGSKLTLREYVRAEGYCTSRGSVASARAGQGGGEGNGLEGGRVNNDR